MRIQNTGFRSVAKTAVCVVPIGTGRENSVTKQVKPVEQIGILVLGQLARELKGSFHFRNRDVSVQLCKLQTVRMSAPSQLEKAAQSRLFTQKLQVTIESVNKKSFSLDKSCQSRYEETLYLAVKRCSHEPSVNKKKWEHKDYQYICKIYSSITVE